VFWLWLGLGTVVALSLVALLAGWFLYAFLLRRYLEILLRIFQERPLLIAPTGQPVDDAEDVVLQTSDGLHLRGCYIRGRCWKRMGVILFGLEFGSNRWSAVPYCEFLLDNGFDVFAFEFRGQGDSDRQPEYEPMQWVTQYELRDMQAAIAYLKKRSDSSQTGVGFFGISKGACAGLMAGSRDPFIRCFVTDGVFATRSTMVPYMQKWIGIFSSRYLIQRLLPRWFYWLIAGGTLRALRRSQGWRFPALENALRRLAPRPLFMIHGGSDTYIKPEMARELLARAKPPKELWIVEGAKHNQALAVAGEEYRRRVLDFFLEHLVSDQEPKTRIPAVRPPSSQVMPRTAGRTGSSPEPVAPRR
jgi:pimeloyl-ACP methyl ester carboxylesterase